MHEDVESDEKELDLGGRQSKLGQNILYEMGNVTALAQYLDGLRTGNTEEVHDEHQTINNLIAKYSSFPIFKRKVGLNKEVVVSYLFPFMSMISFHFGSNTKSYTGSDRCHWRVRRTSACNVGSEPQCVDRVVSRSSAFRPPLA